MFLLSIGASKPSLSLIEGIAESTASLLKSISGYWSDKIGKNKPFMLIGYGLSSLIMPLYAFAIAPVQVLFLRFAERAGKGIRTAPRDSLIAGSVTNGETGKSFGVQKAMDNMGAIVGPMLAFIILLFFSNNYRLIFLLSGIPALFVYFGFGMTKNVGVILMLFAMYGLYSAMTDGVQKAFISDIIDENKKGTGLGIYNALLGITLLPASLLAGYLYNHVNSNVPFYFGACMAVLSSILLLLYTGMDFK